jgi:hypothetical protein
MARATQPGFLVLLPNSLTFDSLVVLLGVILTRVALDRAARVPV